MRDGLGAAEKVRTCQICHDALTFGMATATTAAVGGAGKRAKRQTMMHTRLIPSSGERLPVIGCGTYRGFDVRRESAVYGQLHQVLAACSQLVAR